MIYFELDKLELRITLLSILENITFMISDEPTEENNSSPRSTLSAVNTSIQVLQHETLAELGQPANPRKRAQTQVGLQILN